MCIPMLTAFIVQAECYEVLGQSLGQFDNGNHMRFILFKDVYAGFDLIDLLEMILGLHFLTSPGILLYYNRISI